MAADGRALVQRYERLKADRANFDQRWEQMAPYLVPSRVGIQTQYSPGEKQTRRVYDSTSMMAAELMAQFIAGHLINPSQRWFGLMMRDHRLRGVDAVNEWLEECRDRMLARFGASLFYAEGPESLIDYGGFGTGFLLLEEAPALSNRRQDGFRGFYFQAEKTGRFVIADGPDGLVDTAMRTFTLTARVIRDRWPQATLPEKVAAALQNGKPDTPFPILHAIVPRALAEQRRGGGATAMPWASVWIEQESKAVIHESGYRVFPAAVPRYQRTPGEVYGRGRGDLAYPDTWTLNTAKRLGLEDWELKIRPPMLMRHDAVIGTLRLTPGGPTTVNTHGGSVRDVLMPLETGSDPQVSQLKEEELRKSIRQIFYVDQILQLLEVSKSEMTAFEFAKKIELLFRLLGPVYGRLEWEYLYRVVDIGFDVMLVAGAFPPPPPEVFETDGQIDIEFHNPLAKAQRAGDAEALTLVAQDVAPLVQVSPAIAQALNDRLDPDRTVTGIFEIRGVPARWTRSEEEVTALRAARQQQQQAEQTLGEAGQVAEAMGKAAPMVSALQQGAA